MLRCSVPLGLFLESRTGQGLWQQTLDHPLIVAAVTLTIIVATYVPILKCVARADLLRAVHVPITTLSLPLQPPPAVHTHTHTPSPGAIRARSRTPTPTSDSTSAHRQKTGTDALVSV
jgi:hypothetical protein